MGESFGSVLLIDDIVDSRRTMTKKVKNTLTPGGVVVANLNGSLEWGVVIDGW